MVLVLASISECSGIPSISLRWSLGLVLRASSYRKSLPNFKERIISTIIIIYRSKMDLLALALFHLCKHTHKLPLPSFTFIFVFNLCSQPEK